MDNSTFNLGRFAYHQDNKLNGHSVQYHIDKNDPSSEADEEEFSASYIKRSELNRVHLKTPKNFDYVDDIMFNLVCII